MGFQAYSRVFQWGSNGFRVCQEISQNYVRVAFYVISVTFQRVSSVFKGFLERSGRRVSRAFQGVSGTF